jgi:hypothetical protein
MAITTMSSSTASTTSSCSTQAESAQGANCEGLHEAQLQTLLSPRLFERGDLRALLQLQQTSKQLQAAVAQFLQGQRQLPVAFSTYDEQQLRGLQQWLQKHAGLLKGLQLQIDPYSIDDDSFTQRYDCSTTGVDDIIDTAAQRAVLSLLAVAAENSIPLQLLTLRGTTASRELLQQLSAAHLTELHAQVDFGCWHSMGALAALSSLRRLTLEGRRWDSRHHSAANSSSLAPLAAGLQQLTELNINTVTPDALQLLPPKLQQLHVIGTYSPPEVLQLAEFVGRRGSLLRSLRFDCSAGGTSMWEEEAAAALTALAATFAAAAAADAAPAAAATAPAAAAGTGLQLASLSVQHLSSKVAAAAALLMALPASSLTHLDVHISWASEADIAALCSLTGLRSLQLQGEWNDHSIAAQCDSVLSQLSVLQQLTRLELIVVRKVQLQHLQLPRLQHLDVDLVPSKTGEPLLLGHMTDLTALAVDMEADGWSPAAELPPNLGALKVPLNGYYGEHPSSSIISNNPRSISLQPVLGLSQLQKLHLDLWCTDGAVPAAAEIVQLCTLRSLQEVRVRWDSYQLGDDAAAVEGITAALAPLPLKTLTLLHAGMPAAAMQHLGRMQGLTALELECFAASSLKSRVIASQDRATPAQLAAALRQLASLRHLKLFNDSWGCNYDSDLQAALHAEDCDGVEELLQAIDGLKHLFAIHVDLPVRMKWAAFRQLHMQQLVPNLLARDCAVSVVQRFCGESEYNRTEFIRICIDSPARRPERFHE